MSEVATSQIEQVLEKLGIQSTNEGTSTGKHFFGSGPVIDSYSPVDGSLIGSVSTTTREDYDKVVSTALEAYKSWRMMPAPKRGEIVRQYGDRLRAYKAGTRHAGEL
jgi:aldehyde dehydrogenase (NAD+)